MHNESICAWPPGRLGLAGAPGADLGSLLAGRLACRAGWTAGVYLVAAGSAGDDEQVFVEPADLRAGEAGQERRDRGAQFGCRVEGEGRVVVPLGLGAQPRGGTC